MAGVGGRAAGAGLNLQHLDEGSIRELDHRAGLDVAARGLVLVADTVVVCDAAAVFVDESLLTPDREFGSVQPFCRSNGR
jgi:hypothetical protein